MNTTSFNRYAFADGLRGIAALWVVLYHLHEGHHVAHLTQFIGKWLTLVLFEHGNLGVPVFFVLSGFVMAITTQSKLMRFEQCVKFMLRRVVRLAPPYYVAMIFSLLVLWIKAQQQYQPASYLPDLNVILAHLIFIQGALGYPQINVVFWTLCYEMQFYLVFSIAMYFISKRPLGSYSHFTMIFLLTFSGLLWLCCASHYSFIFLFAKNHLIFIHYWYAFSAGALVAWCASRKNIYRYYLVTFYVSLIIIGYVKSDLFAIATGLTSFMMHMAMIYKSINCWLNFKVVQMLGLMSYSLYLLHNNVTGIFGRIFKVFFTSSVLSEFIFTFFNLFLCAITAYIMYNLVEKPAIKASHKFKY